MFGVERHYACQQELRTQFLPALIVNFRHSQKFYLVGAEALFEEKRFLVRHVRGTTCVETTRRISRLAPNANEYRRAAVSY
jgi:hypothetical protein